MIDTQTITSERSGKEYDLFVKDSKAVGCTCAYRHFHPLTACRHMRAYNAASQHTCILCGQATKATICWKCLN